MRTFPHPLGLALVVLGVLFGTVKKAPAREGADGGVAQAAREIAAAWARGDRDEVMRRAQARHPDPWRVVQALAVTLESAETRRAVLTVCAEAMRKQTPKLAEAARHWGQASATDVRSLRGEVRALSRNATAWRAGDLDDEAFLAVLPPPRALKAHDIVNTLGISWRAQALAEDSDVAQAATHAQNLYRHAGKVGWRHLQGEAARACAGWLQQLGKRKEATEAWIAAAQAARALDQPAAERTALQTAVVLSMNSGDLRQRYTLQFRLAELMEEHAPEHVVVRTGLWLVDAEIRLHALDAAWARATDLLARATPMGDKSLLLNIQTQRLLIRMNQGRLGDALALAGPLQAAWDASRDPQDRARAAMALCALYKDVGRLDDALRLCETTLSEAPEGRARVTTGTGPALLAHASLLEAAGRMDDARAARRSAASLYGEHGQVGRQAAALLGLLDLELRRDEIEHARDVMHEVDALALPDAPRVMARVHATRSRLALAEGHADRALASADEALRAWALGDAPPAELARHLAQRGRALQGMGRHGEAAQVLERATRMQLELARGLGERDALALRRRAHHVARAGWQSCFRQLAQRGEGGPKDLRDTLARAWWLREASQAVLLSRRPAPGPSRATANGVGGRSAGRYVLGLVAEMHRNALRLETMAKATPEIRAKARDELELMHLRYVESVRVEESNRAFGDGAHAVARPIPLATFRRNQLPPRAVALTFVEVAGRMHVLGLQGAAWRVRDLGPADVLREQVAGWRDLVAAPEGPAARLGARLYDQLLRPFEDWLEACDEILVLTDGPLGHVPFSALVPTLDDKGRAAAYVLDRHRVRYVPSGSLLVREYGRLRGKGVLIYGAPTTTPPHGSPPPATRIFPHLAGSRDEATRVAAHYPEAARRLWLGEEASVARWMDAPAREPWRSVHLACHGVRDPHRPQLHGLALADGRVLTAEHVLARPAPADVAVLSACGTGQGIPRAGEGVSGLTRAFLQTGSPRVIVSTWSVSDRATAELMDAFHAAWAPGTLSAGEALRAARLALRQRDDGWSHPYYWAPFVLWGQP